MNKLLLLVMSFIFLSGFSIVHAGGEENLNADRTLALRTEYVFTPRGLELKSDAMSSQAENISQYLGSQASSSEPVLNVLSEQWEEAEKFGFEKPEPLSEALLAVCYDSAPEEIKRIVLNLQPEAVEERADVPEVVILYGPHESGKRTLAHMLAQKTGKEFVSINAKRLHDFSVKNLIPTCVPIDTLSPEKPLLVMLYGLEALMQSDYYAFDKGSLLLVLAALHRKKNILPVFSTNSFDQRTQDFFGELPLKYLTLDVMKNKDRKAAIDYWFSDHETTEFQCRRQSLWTRLFNASATMSSEQSNKEFKDYLAKKLNGTTYGDVKNVFVTARGFGLRRAIKSNASVVTITADDFDQAFSYIAKKKKEREEALFWGGRKKSTFYSPVLTVIGSIVALYAASILTSYCGAYVLEVRRIKKRNNEYIRQKKQLCEELMRQCNDTIKLAA